MTIIPLQLFVLNAQSLSIIHFNLNVLFNDPLSIRLALKYLFYLFIPYTNFTPFVKLRPIYDDTLIFSIFTCILCSQNVFKTSIRQCVKLKTDSEISIQFFVKDDIESQFCSPF